jgi:uncharacterized glyoxalase superfamily protein PhnB
MAKLDSAEQFDRFVEGVLSGSRIPSLPSLAASRADLEDFERIVLVLRDLPRREFREALKFDLERSVSMTESQAARPAVSEVGPIRKGFHSLTPYLIVPGAAKVIDFMKQTFGAEEAFRVARPGTDLIMHAEVKLGDSMIEIADSNDQFPPTPAPLHVYVEDVDMIYKRAIDAGAISIAEPVDQEYGERSCALKDSGGNHWYVARYLGKTYVPEGLRTVNIYLHPQGAAQLIEFIKNAFGAEVAEMHKSPEGVVQHAGIKIGDTILEMGEAHGPYHPMPATIHLYTADADAVYERALSAGAGSIMPVKDQPYGDRSGGVRDAFGNRWFIATHIKDVQF